jgi:predicted alpha/beta superfamily hydrolase
MRVIFVCILICFRLPILFAQHPPVTLPGTEIRSLHSEIVNKDYKLYIKLPFSYDKTEKTYPVFFTTDANRLFSIYSSISLVYETPIFDRDEIIIVGIGYLVSKDRLEGIAEWVVRRRLDFTPKKDIESEKLWKERLSKLLGIECEVKEGGAKEFLEFICKELVPFIDSNYRISKERGLGGYSLGGLFTLYALLNAPETFSKYFAGSPVSYDQWLWYAENLSDVNRDIQAKVLITANGTEKNIWKAIQQLTEILNKNFPLIDVHTYFFKDENHISGGAAASSRSLKVLYYE